MGKYKGLNISGGLAANFKKLRVKKTIAVTELLDRGHVYEGRSDLPTKGAGHRRGRGAEKSNRKGARGATRGSIDLGYVSGDGSNVVVNEDYGLLTENAVPLGQAIKETRRQQGIIDSQAEASITPPAPAVSGTIFQVTVGPKTGGGNAFYINGVEAPALTIVKPGSYIFSQVDPSNVGHPLRFSLDGGITEYTTGVTSHGTIGTVNSYVHIIVGNEDITGLSYYCTVHGQGMGNTIAEGSEVWTPPSANEETGGETGGGQSTPTPTIVSGSNETTIHITTDGGAGVNNSFADSSSNAYTITATGDPQLNTFSPYRHGGYSTNFDGSDYITSPITAIGTGDFTAECWVYPTAFGQYGGVFSSSAIGAPTGISVSVDQWWLGSDTAYTSFVTGNKFTLNTWQHVAVVRNGTTVTGYVDGVAVGTAELATNLTSTSMAVGSRYQNSGSYLMTGTVSDFRLVNSAVYTEAFTPPTERLTAVTGTELLTCHLPYIADGSSNGHSITINGDPQTKPTSPYDRVGYSEDLHGGSVHFIDNTDRLSATVTAPGTGDFTMEAWVYFDTLTGNQSIMALGNYVPALYYRSATTEMAVYYSSGQPILQTGFTPKIGQWYHMAMVRESGTVKVYIDGKQEGSSATLSSNLTSTTLNIGYDGVDYFGGNLGDVRYSTSAVYTADFTPPAAPLESTGAELHIKGVEGHIIDKAQSGNNFTIVGNTTASTAESKYAGSSIYFDGGGDYIKLDGSFSEFFDNPWTIEFWVYLNSSSTSNAISIGDGSGVDGMYLLHGGNGFYLGSNGSWNISAYTSSTITVGQWHHCAVTWDGSDYRIFVDGALENTATSSAKLGPGPYTIAIGATYTGVQPTDGYIEDLRLTKGLARYTEAFTPPTESLATYSTTGGETGSGLEETIPQVTALQGSMTVGDTATIETNGVSKFTPTENFTATVKMWGAAGGNGTNSFGGRGGYTEGTYEFQAGTTYQILVGQGGKSNNGTSGGVDTRTGGGGRVGVTANGNDFRATGGGYTGLFNTTILQSNALLIAGGGGGGGPTGYPGTDDNAGGGDGGGTTGTDGSNGGFAGGGPGGTQLAGGAAGSDAGSYGGTVEAGSALLGGGAKATITENYTGSGGGGGYFGGGGGGSNNYAGGAGGGGSSYIHTSITNGQTISGVDIDNKTGTERGTVPGSTETEWNGTAGSQAATKAKEGEAPDGQITITVIDPNAQPSSSTVAWGGDRAIVAGGTGAANTSNIDYFSISTVGSVTKFGDLISTRYYMASSGLSDSNYCLFLGGSDGSNRVDTIEYVTSSIPSASTTDFGNLSSGSMDGTSGVCDATYGLHLTGYLHPNYINTIDYFTIASPGNATDFGDATDTQHSRGGGTNDSTRGVFIGGYGTAGAGTTDYVTIATPANAQNFGNLINNNMDCGACSNGVLGVVGGGYNSSTFSQLSALDYITIQTLGNSANAGDLTVARHRVSSCSDGSIGVWAGGNDSSPYNTIDYVTLSTTGNATDYGDLTVGGYGGQATSGNAA